MIPITTLAIATREAAIKFITYYQKAVISLDFDLISTLKATKITKAINIHEKTVISDFLLIDLFQYYNYII